MFYSQEHFSRHSIPYEWMKIILLSSSIPYNFSLKPFPSSPSSTLETRLATVFHSTLLLYLPEMFPVLLSVTVVYKKVWFEVSMGSRIHYLHPHWIPYLVPGS